MAGSEAVDASQAAGRLAEAAASLLDHLAGCHYAIGVDHYLRAERLMASLAVSGQMPQNTRDLEAWLRPLICQSARDQERFAKDFEDWLRARGEAAAPFVPPEEPVEEVLREVKKGGRRWLLVGGILALALAALVAIALRTAPATPPSTPPIPAAPAVKQIGYPAFALGFPVVVFAALVAWLLWRRSKARAFLVQCETGAPASSASLSVAAAEPPIYNPRLLALAARGFGIYRRLPSEALNVPASVEATAREAGRFIPVPASRPAVPEYLVLIDRGSQADLFAQFGGGLVKRLEESNVAVDQFYFDRVPQQCYTRRGHQPITVRELTEHFPEHRVLVFSDGAGFLRPAGSALASWMEVFVAWEMKILLTPNPRAYWGEREAFIAAAGWTVVPAEQEEIAALAHQVEPESSEEGFIPGLLGSLTADERRWLRRSMPAREEIEALLTDLRVSLGAAGFHWLCACAAYPAVDWTVALYLGTNLRHGDGRPLLREPSFLAISRLPWFRYGVMPVWLRLALLGKLSREEQRGVRQALQMFLMSGLAGPLETYRLTIKQELRGPLNWLTRQFIRRRARRAGNDDPLRDEVFVKFLSGGNPAALPLPRRIGNLFRSAPGQWLGFSRLDVRQLPGGDHWAGRLAWRLFGLLSPAAPLVPLAYAFVLRRSSKRRPQKTTAAAPASTDTTTGARIVAALAYWFFGLLALPFYWRNRFVRFHAVQAVVLYGGCFFLSVLANLLTPLAIVAVVYLVATLLMTIQALRGKMTRLPLIGPWTAGLALRGAPPPASAAALARQAPPASPASVRKPAVFLSSTSDMRAEREAVREALLKFDVRLPQAVVSAYSDMEPREAVLSRLAESTAFVGIIGSQSGYIDPDSGTTLVQFEYEQARRLRLPCLIYIKRTSGESAIDQVADFRKRLDRETLVRYFETPDELPSYVLRDIQNIISARNAPAPPAPLS